MQQIKTLIVMILLVQELNITYLSPSILSNSITSIGAIFPPTSTMCSLLRHQPSTIVSCAYLICSLWNRHNYTTAKNRKGYLLCNDIQILWFANYRKKSYPCSVFFIVHKMTDSTKVIHIIPFVEKHPKTVLGVFIVFSLSE